MEDRYFGNFTCPLYIKITGETGFAGASYYAETFRKWTGKSPTEYRNEYII